MAPQSPIDARRDSALRAFQDANPSYWRKAHDDPERVSRITNILERQQALRVRMEEHFQNNVRQWLDREVAARFADRSAPHLKHPAPSWANSVSPEQLIRDEAERRVTARMQQRRANLERTGQRIAKRIATGREATPRQNQSLQVGVHEAVRRAQILRKDCVRHFAMNKDQWVRQARARGSQTPESDVYRKQAQRMAQIDRAERTQVQQVMQQHGVAQAPVRSGPDRSGPSMSR